MTQLTAYADLYSCDSIILKMAAIAAGRRWLKNCR